MNKILASLLIISMLTAMFITTGCNVIVGSGKLVTEQKDFKDFTAVQVGGAFDVEITKADTFSVSITADDNVMPEIQVSKSNDTLNIGMKTGSFSFTTQKAVITMPDLRSVELSGASHGTVTGFRPMEEFTAEASGASTIDLADIGAAYATEVGLNASGASKINGSAFITSLKANASGASLISLEGSGIDIEVDASGASHVELGGFLARNADVTISGASGGTIAVSGKLDAEISGASNLAYIGEPTMGNIEVSGASKLQKK